ncbi:MAG: glycosyltransferase family 2 protein [Solirubrobacteraceae bacterium]
MPPATVSVIIRARDEAGRIARCLEAIQAQVGAPSPELIVVDNESRDATARIARDAGATVIALRRTEFSFGGALNLGAANASGEILVALSADAVAGDRGWLARLLEPFADEQVACASGERFLPDGKPLTGPVRQDAELLAAEPEWGYSNGAGAFRAELWRARGFRADLPGCEDSEWASYWIGQGYLCVVDPALALEHDHTHDTLQSIYRRARREAAGFALFLPTPAPTPRELVAEWWSDLRFYDSALKARLSHRRAARLLGAYAGRRSVNR